MRIHHPRATTGIVVAASVTFASSFRAPIESNRLSPRANLRRVGTELFSTRERKPAAVSELSRQVAEMRSQIASENEDANLIMQALRGRNINDDDEQVRERFRLVIERATEGQLDGAGRKYGPLQ